MHRRSEARQLRCVSVVCVSSALEDFVDLSLQLVLEG
jgi:hypothetical protein